MNREMKKHEQNLKITVLSFFNNKKGDTTRNLVLCHLEYEETELKEITRAYHAIGALDKFGANLGSNYRITKHGQEILDMLREQYAGDLFS